MSLAFEGHEPEMLNVLQCMGQSLTIIIIISKFYYIRNTSYHPQ